MLLKSLKGAEKRPGHSDLRATHTAEPLRDQPTQAASGLGAGSGGSHPARLAGPAVGGRERGGRGGHGGGERRSLRSVAGRPEALVPHRAGRLRLQTAESGERDTGGAARRRSERQSRSDTPVPFPAGLRGGRRGFLGARGCSSRRGVGGTRVRGSGCARQPRAPVREPAAT